MAASSSRIILRRPLQTLELLIEFLSWPLDCLLMVSARDLGELKLCCFETRERCDTGIVPVAFLAEL